VVGAALALSVTGAVGQSGPNASPADVAREFFAAQRDGRWLDAAHLLDLNAIEALRTSSVANARHAQPQFHLTVEKILQHSPSMPRAVAEYQVKEWEAASHDFNPLAYEFADVTTADSLAALPIDIAGARWLEARDLRWQFKKQPLSFSGECPQPSDSDRKEIEAQIASRQMAASLMLTPPVRDVVAVTNGRAVSGATDSVSYVLFRDHQPTVWDSAARARMTRPEMQMSPGVLTLIRTPGGWRVVPVPDLGSAGAMSGFATMTCVIDSVKTGARKK
jgi:hypothetical protein